MHDSVVRFEKSVEPKSETARGVDRHYQRVFAFVRIVFGRQLCVYAVNFVFFHDVRDIGKRLVFALCLVVYAIADRSEYACCHNVGKIQVVCKTNIFEKVIVFDSAVVKFVERAVGHIDDFDVVTHFRVENTVERAVASAHDNPVVLRKVFEFLFFDNVEKVHGVTCAERGCQHVFVCAIAVARQSVYDDDATLYTLAISSVFVDIFSHINILYIIYI